jgi:hypothetical protein
VELPIKIFNDDFERTDLGFIAKIHKEWAIPIQPKHASIL